LIKKISKLEGSHYINISKDLLENVGGSHGIIGISGALFWNHWRGFHNPEYTQCISEALKNSV
jgi:hypothetical protein